jgi:hypothetical protein
MLIPGRIQFQDTCLCIRNPSTPGHGATPSWMVPLSPHFVQGPVFRVWYINNLRGINCLERSRSRWQFFAASSKYHTLVAAALRANESPTT